MSYDLDIYKQAKVYRFKVNLSIFFPPSWKEFLLVEENGLWNVTQLS